MSSMYPSSARRDRTAIALGIAAAALKAAALIAIGYWAMA